MRSTSISGSSGSRTRVGKASTAANVGPEHARDRADGELQALCARSRSDRGRRRRQHRPPRATALPAVASETRAMSATTACSAVVQPQVRRAPGRLPLRGRDESRPGAICVVSPDGDRGMQCRASVTADRPRPRRGSIGESAATAVGRHAGAGRTATADRHVDRAGSAARWQLPIGSGRTAARGRRGTRSAMQLGQQPQQRRHAVRRRRRSAERAQVRPVAEDRADHPRARRPGADLDEDPHAVVVGGLDRRRGSRPCPAPGQDRLGGRLGGQRRRRRPSAAL